MEKIHATKERIMRASFKLFLENGYETHRFARSPKRARP